MHAQEIINIDIFKVVTRAIAQSDNLDVMANHLTQLLVGVLGIKGSTIFILDPNTQELDILASFGISVNYLNKGPLMLDKSIVTDKREPTVISDIDHSDLLQYPEDAKREGIGGMVSLPIFFKGEMLGALRLYHHQKWEIAERDVDSLLILSENIGLAMMYTRLLQTIYTIKNTVRELPHHI